MEKSPEADAKARALELLSKLNFKEPERIWDSYPFEMSGGMNQRAGIAISMLDESAGIVCGRAYQCAGCDSSEAGGSGDASCPGIVWNGDHHRDA